MDSGGPSATPPNVDDVVDLYGEYAKRLRGVRYCRKKPFSGLRLGAHDG